MLPVLVAIDRPVGSPVADQVRTLAPVHESVAVINRAGMAGPEKSDVLWSGRKIAGAAQRRNKLGLLIQGSVQPPPIPLVRADWEMAMREAARKRFDCAWAEFSPDAQLNKNAGKLARQKYSQNSCNQKR